MKKILLSLFIASTLSSCSGIMHDYSFLPKNGSKEQNSTTSASSKFSEKYKLYEVLPTDNIASVARKLKILPEDIIRYNGLKRPYFLKSGELLKIPTTKNEDDNLIEAVDSLDNTQESSNRHIQIGPRAKLNL